jgi:nucleoside-diphosphate-sugar epimerase
METIKDKVKTTLNGNHTTPSGNGKTILITGGSGFVAAHVLNAFLSRGYNVRTTVRSQETAKKVKKSHAKYLSQLSFAIVPDVATPGGHDEAVKGIDGVCPGPSKFSRSQNTNS